MSVAMTTKAPEELLASIHGPLLELVQDKLCERAEQLRRALPPRPEDALARFRWWRSLDADQGRRAMLMERLDALSDRLRDHPAIGRDPLGSLPAEALEEAEGFDEELSELIARFRRVLEVVAAQR
ncbi:hypothetical protein [Streptomyces sp. NBC_01304]|uniref:hypothetical protein n=1 Tax=Streptomyces sp. NBC_01304 TaxID=2903818 RepID=UPI002E0F6886|nr:hypothetical protein OG430_47725 [Streptomyces sp. NBC_01304]